MQLCRIWVKTPLEYTKDVTTTVIHVHIQEHILHELVCKVDIVKNRFSLSYNLPNIISGA